MKTDNNNKLLIAGPCSVESEEQLILTARAIKEMGKVDYLRAGIWKPRTNPGGYEGAGIKGLSWLLNAKNERLKHIFAQTPNHQLFIENDAAASQVAQIYEAAAVIKKCELDVMKEIIFANYKTVFTHE